MEEIYRKLFTLYLVKKFKLKEFDDRIFNSGLNFPVVQEDEMDKYQYLTKNLLKYFYIRNDINVDTLSNDEKQYLINLKNFQDEFELDENIKRFVEQTYKKAIFKDVLKDGKKYSVAYGPNSSQFFAPNDAIVIGFRYDEFADVGLSDEEWSSLNDKQREYLNDVLKKLQEYSTQNSDVPVSIIEYDETSIQYRETISKEIDKEER